MLYLNRNDVIHVLSLYTNHQYENSIVCMSTVQGIVQAADHSYATLVSMQHMCLCSRQAVYIDGMYLLISTSVMNLSLLSYHKLILVFWK